MDAIWCVEEMTLLLCVWLWIVCCGSIPIRRSLPPSPIFSLNTRNMIFHLFYCRNISSQHSNGTQRLSLSLKTQITIDITIGRERTILSSPRYFWYSGSLWSSSSSSSCTWIQHRLFFLQNNNSLLSSLRPSIVSSPCQSPPAKWENNCARKFRLMTAWDTLYCLLHDYDESDQYVLFHGLHSFSPSLPDVLSSTNDERRWVPDHHWMLPLMIIFPPADFFTGFRTKIHVWRMPPMLDSN